jgi:lysophospholipase L1-like esterase
MDAIGKIALLTSVLLNLLIVGVGGVLVYSKGGISYIIRQVSLLQNPELRADIMYDVPYYWSRKTHFETLPQSNADIVFLGDSLTDSCEWQEFFRNAAIKNRGISGDTTKGILNRIDEVVEVQPQKLFIMIGINDINQGREVDAILSDYEVILRTFKERIPQTQVFVQSILPVNNQKFVNIGVNKKVMEINSKLREFSQKFSFQYIDLYSGFLDGNNQLDARYTIDGIHLNGQGYLAWKKMIEPEVEQ